jgi:hypothetical protein
MEQTKNNIALANGRDLDLKSLSSRRRFLALGGSALLGAGIGQVGPATASECSFTPNWPFTRPDSSSPSLPNYWWFSDLNYQIVQWARSQLGRCVSDNKGTSQPGVCVLTPEELKRGVLKGECTHLVHSAVVSGTPIGWGGWPPDYSHPPHYTWGKSLKVPVTNPQSEYLPGNIIQLAKTRFDGPNGAYRETPTQHTAIIESVKGTVLHLLEQHAPERIVTRGTLDLGWRLSRGDYAVFQAWPAFLCRA